MSKIKCPFCGQELKPYYGYGIELYSCSNLTCKGTDMKAEGDVWQELIRTKKQLNLAIKCINWTIDTFQKGLEHESDVVGCCELSLERIEELEQKDAK